MEGREVALATPSNTSNFTIKPNEESIFEVS
jgi:hypothetical protein